MSDQNPYATNPYAANPFADGEPLAAGADPSQHPLMQELIVLLSQTRPWVRLFGILTAIGAVLMVIGGGVMIGAGDPGMAVVGAVYMAMAGLYIYPAMCLSRYASRIKTTELTGEMASVVDAIREQKKFWRFSGIVATVILIIYGFFFVIAFAGVIISAMF